MATQRVWADVSAFVSEECRHEKAQPNRDHFLRLANECLGLLSEGGWLYETSWSNAAGGALTLSDNSATLPIELLEINSVEWDGDDNLLDFKSVAWLDENNAGWRSNTGEPEYYTVEGNNLLLSTTPAAPTTGKLVIRGRAALPDFSDTVGATNPLIYLPWHMQMAPAHYILANLPADPGDPAAMARIAKHERLWQRDEGRLLSGATLRKWRPFTY